MVRLYSLIIIIIIIIINNNSMALVRERIIQIEQSPLVGEVSANFCGERVLRGQRGRSPTAVILVF
jgi:hypothetical protein